RPGEKFKSYGLSDLKIKDSLIKKTNLVRQIWLDNYYYGSVFSANYNKKNTDFIFGGAILKYDAKHYGFIKWAEMGVPVDYRWYNLPAHKTDINFFGKIQQQLADGFFAFGDMQIRDVVYKISGFRKNPTVQSDNHYTFFNPKLGLSYILKHDYNASSKLFASYAIANKEPNREDFEASPDNTPRHETLYDVEAGYLYNAINYFLGITGYYMKYNNQLILSGKINDVGAYVRTNVKDSYRAGIELTGSARFTDWITLDANATFSKNKIRNITQFSDDYDYGGQIEQTFSNTDISLSPGAIMGATATFEPFFNKLKTNRFYIDIMEKYVSRQYLDNGMDKLKSINPYSLTDLRLRFEASHKNLKELGIVLLVNNIFNKKYENNGYTFSYKYHGTLTTENYYFPQAGINWNLGITIGF
ncbi:MAG TPA: TonB-dependent receptor, partial [Niabella sp.]|nr:TonB-dependent receptor [Niabella sp.]